MQLINLMANIILLKQSPLLKFYIKPQLHTEQPQLSKPFLIEMSHPFDHFFAPSLDLIQQLHAVPLLVIPELYAVLQAVSHWHGVKG